MEQVSVKGGLAELQRSPTPSRAKILAVDDQPARLLSYEAILGDLAVEVVRALSGREALAQLLKHDFAAILLDVSMPEMDGFELARVIRAHPRLERTPIVFITGVHVSDLDQLKGYEAGAIDYISIPVVPEILRSKVAILVELYQRRRELQAVNEALQQARSQLESEQTQAPVQRAARMRAVFEHPALFTLILEAERDAAGNIIDWVYRDANANALALTGATRESLLGRRVSETVPDRAQRLSAVCRSVLSQGEPTIYESSLEGHEFSITVYPIAADAVVSTALDITERKRAEMALRQSEERFRELANSIDQFAWTCDSAGRVSWYNQRWYDYTGTTSQEMLGEGWKSVHHPAHVDRVVEHLERCLAAGKEWEDTYPLRGRDGRYRWFLSRAVPIRDEHGRVQRWFGTNTDVTDSRQLQLALEQADRRKNEFLAMLAHELRNPLTPICNAAAALLQLIPPDASQQRLLAGMVRRQGSQLARLIDDLLDVARITQGRIDLKIERVSILSCIEAAIEMVEPLVREKQHQLIVTQSLKPLHVSGDRVRLVQCVANLLINAAKYTNPEGEIRVRHYEEASQAVIEVTDTGVGISAELLPQIFDLFVQGDQALDRSQGGLGVGLAICKQLIEMHQGSIEARSEGVGHGATFVVRLPLARAAREPSPGTDDSGGCARRVLVVDDNRDAADSLAVLLRLEGHEAAVAYSGESALEVLAHADPDFVLLDIGLPGMDGYEVGRRMRSAGARACIIALTGYGQQEDRQRSADAGFAAHLVKPVDIDVLKALLSAG